MEISNRKLYSLLINIKNDIKKDKSNENIVIKKLDEIISKQKSIEDRVRRIENKLKKIK
jgi:hypothetical protein